MKGSEIPRVPTSLLIKANEALGAAKGDPIITIVAALADEYPTGQLHAASLRLMALTKIVKERNAGNWTLFFKGQGYALIDGALFEAAARASLRATRATLMQDIAFDEDEFLKLALASAQPEGSG